MARSIKAFLKAMEAALTASALMGPVTNWSINSLGIRGRAADLAAMAAFFNLDLLGINAPIGHVMPQTQNSGQARPLVGCVGDIPPPHQPLRTAAFHPLIHHAKQGIQALALRSEEHTSELQS